MELTGAQASLADILHIIAQGLLVPVIVLLIAFIGYALFCIGSIIMEAVKERRDYKVEGPKFLRALMDADETALPEVIKNEGLLNRQKAALLTVYDYRALPGDALIALVRRLVSQEESHYKHIIDRNNTAAKVSPMIGLMGTLIPLGPGVAALGQADTAALSSSLLIAFDTTVAGLVVAAVCLVIGKIRSNWYEEYLATLDSAMATMLEKIGAMREAGEITSDRPSDFAQRFLEGLGKDAPAKPEAGAAAAAENEQPKPVAAGEPADAPAEAPFAAGAAELPSDNDDLKSLGKHGSEGAQPPHAES